MIGLLILAISYCSRLKSSRSIPEHLIGVCYIDLVSSQFSDMCGINFNNMGSIFFPVSPVLGLCPEEKLEGCLYF